MSDIARFDAQAGTIVAGGRRIVFHCHHYNTLLQRSVDDALGARGGFQHMPQYRRGDIVGQVGDDLIGRRLDALRGDW